MTIMIMAAVFFAFERLAENTRSQPDHIAYNVGTLWKHKTYMYAQGLRVQIECDASVALWTATENESNLSHTNSLTSTLIDRLE